MFEQQVPATQFGCVPSRRRKMRTSGFKPIVSFVMSAAVDVNDEQTRILAGWYADKRAVYQRDRGKMAGRSAQVVARHSAPSWAGRKSPRPKSNRIIGP